MEPLWGRQTELAIANFPIAGRPLDVRIGHELARIKRHAAAVNLTLDAGGLDADMVAAIGDAARRIESGELDADLPVDVYQTGSGTSTNMNVNEVIATLAGICARAGRQRQRSRQRLAVLQRHGAQRHPDGGCGAR